MEWSQSLPLKIFFPCSLGGGGRYSGTEKVPQRTFATNISPNFRVNFLVRFASKPFVLLGSALKLFRRFFGTVRAIFWVWGSFLAPEVFLSSQYGATNHLCKACRSAAVKFCPETARGNRHGICREISGEILLLLFPQETKLESACDFSRQISRHFSPDALQLQIWAAANGGVT